MLHFKHSIRQLGFALSLSWAVLLLFLQPLAAETLQRTWQSVDGRKAQMTLLKVEGEEGVFQLPSNKGGKEIRMSLDRLAPRDAALAEKWAASNALSTGTEANSDSKEGDASVAVPLPDKPIAYPQVVEVKSSQVEVRLLDEPEAQQLLSGGTEAGAGSWFIYFTPHFELRSQEKLSISVMKDVARTFEAFHELIAKLPWAMVTDPGVGRSGRYLAELYSSKENYIDAGGSSDSAGVYYSSRKKFMAPFESLGLKKVGKRYAKAEDYDQGTLIHELTHQLMHHYLSLISTPITEGAAEFCEVIPFQTGRFRVEGMKSSLKKYLKLRAERSYKLKPELGQPLAFLSMSDDSWQEQCMRGSRSMARLYFKSLLLFYYFAHLDGAEEGAAGLRLQRYMHALSADAQKLIDYEKEAERYQKQLDTFADSKDSKKKRPVPPRNPFGRAKVLEIREERLGLLIDGRSEEQLYDEMVEAYRGIGIRILSRREADEEYQGS